MNKYIVTILVCVLAVAHVPTAFGQDEDALEGIEDRDKRAQTGMQFLSIALDPRGAALADAMTAVNDVGSVAMFYNPAGMARLDGAGHLALGNVQWIADIKYNYASAAYSPGNVGVFGLTVMAADYGDLEETIRADNQRGYQRMGSFSPSALAIGVGYARALSDRFAVGGNARFVRQDLGESIMTTGGDTQSNEVSTATFDFGVLYNTGFRSLNLAMSARNFSPALEYEEESFETPLNLTIGMSMDMTDLMAAAPQNHSFLLTVGADHPRSFEEQLRFGGEYRFMDLLSLRAGYVFPSDEQSVSLGAGLNVSIDTYSLRADYSFSQLDVLDDIHRVGLAVGF